jgi:hypothetical protein
MWSWSIRLDGQPRARTAATLVLLVAHVVLATAYAIPDLSVSRLTTPGQSVSIVNYIDDRGPWWMASFAAVAALLLVAMVTRRGLHLAHLLGGVVVSAYAAAIWFGAFASEPNRPIISAVLASLVAAWHLVLSGAYAEAVFRR